MSRTKEELEREIQGLKQSVSWFADRIEEFSETKQKSKDRLQKLQNELIILGDKGKEQYPEEYRSKTLAHIAKLWADDPNQRLGQLLLNLARDDNGEINQGWLWNEENFGEHFNEIVLKKYEHKCLQYETACRECLEKYYAQVGNFKILDEPANETGETYTHDEPHIKKMEKAYREGYMDGGGDVMRDSILGVDAAWQQSEIRKEVGK